MSPNSFVSTLQSLKGARYRLKIVVTELEAQNASVEYQVSLLSFVNCLINATQGLRERIRLRNEFIGECDNQLTQLIVYAAKVKGLHHFCIKHFK